MSTKENDRSPPAPPRIDWDDSGTPIASRFGDPYYSRDDGRAETRHVFLGLNDLPARWANTTHFTIAELGFGTGLNFFETLAHWRSAAKPAEARLVYVAFELYLLSAADLEQAIGVWPTFQSDCDLLLTRWPLANDDRIEIDFEGNVRLEVHLGDANDAVSQWSGLADTWFLDGFSPAKNPAMWGAELMRDVYRRTTPNGTFATFTAAGWVRRNLIAAGFTVEKAPGYGRKRECLRGKKDHHST